MNRPFTSHGSAGRHGPAAVRPRVGISRCLLGDEVRYDGGHRRAGTLVEALAGRVEWVPVCPEVEVGMGVPREPIRLVSDPLAGDAGGTGVRLLGVTSGTDWTVDMTRWAHERVGALGPLAGFVLKARSPSCGPEGVPVVSAGAASGEATAGRGLFAQVLLEMLPDLPVAHEEALELPDAREAFVARVLEYARRTS